MAELDTKLLRVFREIYDSKSISQAALILGLSQPTISIYLGKLRTHYGDPLFVRSSKGMEPTPFAAGLSDHVTTAVAAIDAVANYETSFDPIATDRTFRIAMTDISQIVLLPRLMRHLATAAPRVSTEVLHISADTRDQFERGEVDIAVGFMPQLDAGFYQQKMFNQHYLCIAAAVHPTIQGRLTLAAFLQEPHVRVSSGGTGHAIVDKMLREQGHQRRVLLDVPNYLGLLEIIAGTQCLAIVPEGLASVIGLDPRIQVLDLPPEVHVPSYLVKQHWHGRNHRDPANQWLRGVLTDLFLNRPEPKRRNPV